MKHRGTEGLWRKIWRFVLATFYAVAGWFHLTTAGPFLKIMPAWVPSPELVVTATGIAELLGAVALAQPWWPALRRAGGGGLALYALCVWPANFQHMALDIARPDGGLGLAYHVPRLAAQPLLIWLALWVGGALPGRRPARPQSSLPATP